MKKMKADEEEWIETQHWDMEGEGKGDGHQLGRKLWYQSQSL